MIMRVIVIVIIVLFHFLFYFDHSEDMTQLALFSHTQDQTADDQF